MAYPTVLRQKALDYYQECKNLSQVSRVFGISLFALKQWVKLQKQTGSLEHRIKGGNATKVDKEKLLQYLAEHPVTARSFCHHFAFILSLWRMPK